MARSAPWRSTAIRRWCARSRDTGKAIGAAGLEAHADDARRHLARDAGTYDVIFLDPPFAQDDWAWLLPACVARLEGGGFIYAEAGRALDAAAGLATWRHAKAGAVHYHLFTLAEPPAHTVPP